MPRDGYNIITLSEDLLSEIDSLVDPDIESRKSRQKIISEAIKQWKLKN